MFVSARFPVSLVAASLAVTLGAVAWTPLVAQNPLDLSQWIPRPLRDSGRPVVPLFEGWFQNEDGTYTLAFGYQSQNLEEDYDIPVGPDNFIEPSQYNGGSRPTSGECTLSPGDRGASSRSRFRRTSVGEGSCGRCDTWGTRTRCPAT